MTADVAPAPRTEPGPGPRTSGRRPLRRPGRRLSAVLLAGTLLLSGCGFSGAYSLPLPGGADVGDHPYRVTIEFDDVLDLVPQAAVRVDDVPVGRVESVDLSGWTAVATVLVNGDVELPANATAQIQQSSLLGEKYVELASPGDDVASGVLGDGGRIALASTGRDVTVEEVLGALSLVLNGGGLSQLQTINRELGDALEGREGALRDTLTQLDTFIAGLDEQKAEITRALDSVNALSGTLAAQTDTIATALDTIGPGLDVFNQQEDALVTMLSSLSDLGDVGSRLIQQSGANVVADLQQLQPILTQLAASGDDLTGALDLLLTYPFPSEAVDAIYDRGDGVYTNMTARLSLDLSDLLCQFVYDPVSGLLTTATGGTLDLGESCDNANGDGTVLGPVTGAVTDATGALGGGQLLSLPELQGTVVDDGTGAATDDGGSAGTATLPGLPALGSLLGGQQ